MDPQRQLSVTMIPLTIEVPRFRFNDFYQIRWNILQFTGAYFLGNYLCFKNELRVDISNITGNGIPSYVLQKYLQGKFYL